MVPFYFFSCAHPSCSPLLLQTLELQLVAFSSPVLVKVVCTTAVERHHYQKSLEIHSPPCIEIVLDTKRFLGCMVEVYPYASLSAHHPLLHDKREAELEFCKEANPILLLQTWLEDHRVRLACDHLACHTCLDSSFHCKSFQSICCLICNLHTHIIHLEKCLCVFFLPFFSLTPSPYPPSFSPSFFSFPNPLLFSQFVCLLVSDYLMVLKD